MVVRWSDTGTLALAALFPCMSHAGVLQVTLATPIYSTANSYTSDSLVDLSGVLLLLSVAQLLLPQLPMTGTERCCCYWRSGYAGCCCLSTRLAPMLLTTKCCSSPVACRNAVCLLYSCIQHTAYTGKQMVSSRQVASWVCCNMHCKRGIC